MKQIFSFLLVFLWSLASIGQSFLGSISKPVNFREGPGIEYRTIKTLRQGAQVFIFSSELENDFYNIIDIESNKEGYVNKSYITIERPLPKNTEGIFNPKGSTTTYNSELEIFNNTNKILSLRLNKEVFTFNPYEKSTLNLLPRDYKYIASAPLVIPDYGNESVKSSSAYSWEFYIITRYK